MAGRGSVTEPLSQYLDWFLRPLLRSVPSFLLDTKDLLQNIETFNIGPGYGLATIDVVSLYTRINHENGITAIKTFLLRSNRDESCIDFIGEALRFVLTHNAFCFGDDWFEQKVGTTMGTPVAPTFANLFLALWEEEFIYSVNNPYLRYIAKWLRFIDDVVIVWTGSQEQFNAFMQYLNVNNINMQFTGNYGGTQVEFLDVRILLKGDKIFTEGYRKPTATNSLLHHTSFHPSHVKSALPYGQFLRLRRINSEYSSFLEQFMELMDRLRQRGYDENSISRAFTRAVEQDRKQLISGKRKKKQKEERCVFSFEFSPMSNNIRQIVRKYWHILESDSDLSSKTNCPPIISFRRSKNLRDEQVRGRFYDKDKKYTKNWLNEYAPKGNHKCGNCSCCKQMMKGEIVHMGGVQHVVKDLIPCRSNFLVYAIFCPCSMYYIGKTIRPVYKRIREHMYSLKSGKGAPRLISHMRTEHNNDASLLRFAGLQKIQVPHNGGDRQNELLRCEAKWILDVNAMGPLGLNDRNDLASFL